MWLSSPHTCFFLCSSSCIIVAFVLWYIHGYLRVRASVLFPLYSLASFFGTSAFLSLLRYSYLFLLSFMHLCIAPRLKIISSRYINISLFFHCRNSRSFCLGFQHWHTIVGVAMGPVSDHIIDFRLIPWYASLVGVMMPVLFQSPKHPSWSSGYSHCRRYCLHIWSWRLPPNASGVVDHHYFWVWVSSSLRSYFPSESGPLREQGSMRCRSYAWEVSIFLHKSWFQQFCLQIFIGQVIGTSVGAHIFMNFGWRAVVALSMGFTPGKSSFYSFVDRTANDMVWLWRRSWGEKEDGRGTKKGGRTWREIASLFPLNCETIIEQKVPVEHSFGNGEGKKDAVSLPMTRISETTANGILLWLILE